MSDSHASADRPHQHRPGSIYDRRLMWRLVSFARPHTKALSATVLILISSLALRLVGPEILKRVIDGPVAEAARTRGTPAYDAAALQDELLGYVGWFLAVAIAMALLGLAREWLTNRTGQLIVYEIRNKLFSHVLRLPTSWFDRHHVGWTVTRSTSDVDALSEMFTTGITTIVTDLLTIVVLIVALLWIAPALSVPALLILPVMVYVSFRFRLNARRAFRATRESLSRLNAFLQERLTGLNVVRLFHREAASTARFDQLNTVYYRDNMKTVKHFSLFFPTVDTLALTIKIATLVWGAWLIVRGDVTAGVLLQFWFYLNFIFDPIRELAERYNILQAAMAAAERIFGILDTDTEAQASIALPAGERPPAVLPGHDEPAAIAFEDVSFAYPSGGDVLHDVSFTIPAGKRVAVVGHTGAGKTTLVNLLCRFHETPRGCILLDGTDICSIPHAELRRRIAIVQQDVFLFSETIAANIRMGDEDMPLERVIEVSKAVHAHPFIERLENGYETMLQERGANLSAGQRQLLAFARALAADPDILVLDEATSSVDSETENLIEDATRVLLEGRTSLVIAHRLSTIVSADRILVMHKGELREQGTHDELMAAKGLYHKLYKLHLSASV